METCTADTKQYNIDKVTGTRLHKAEVLKAGYTKQKRAFEICTLITFFSLWTFALYNISSVLSFKALPLVLVGAYISLFVADFIGGVVHWVFDTWGSLDTPLIGQTFIRSFREHHLAPRAMCEHDFVEISADACFPAIPFLIGASYVDATSLHWVFQLVLICTIWTTLYVMITNQVHKWAHTKDAPSFVRKLQNKGWILDPKHHHIHHTSPYEEHYCILNGWMNPVLASIDFWRRSERLITAVTGAIPRADDQKWTE